MDLRRDEGQEWLIYGLTDHGGIGLGHGDQRAENKRTWQLWENPLDPRFAGKGRLTTGRGLDVVAPTILAFLMGDSYDPAKFPLLAPPIDTDKTVPPPQPAAISAAANTAALSLLFSAALLLLSRSL